ncbi:DUF6336 family protein [Streptomyces sp. E2N166]|uniref:DUF6336 family protein n=1 Tax=Streptomyces sp. E2N166 TaxID=1851909 RepID=UPI000EF6ED46|nr:DUF6336 family protein [Streptomyces sp. E2N166]
MALDQDGVMLPRLRPADVARRGVVFGLLGVVPLVVATLSVSGHSDRRDFLAVVGALVLFGAIFLVIGAGFWWASAGDIRRVRDWRTLTGQAASATIVGPVFLRSGLFLVVLVAAALGLYQLVDTAPYDSWLYS